jgi:glutathione S-transferase
MPRLYYDPMATTCRPIMLFAAETGLDLDYSRVDLFSGEQRVPPFIRINPNAAVPVLEDGDFILTESSAILKYLAEVSGSPAYPRNPKARARINEMMDWFNTGFMRSFCYGLVYTEVLPDYRLPEPARSQLLAHNHAEAIRRLAVLDGLIDGRPFLCGESITIADYFAAGPVSLGELVGFDLSRWPNVARWYAAMKSRPHWFEANAGLYGWKSAIDAQARLSA